MTSSDLYCKVTDLVSGRLREAAMLSGCLPEIQKELYRLGTHQEFQRAVWRAPEMEARIKEHNEQYQVSG